MRKIVPASHILFFMQVICWQTMLMKPRSINNLIHRLTVKIFRIVIRISRSNLRNYHRTHSQRRSNRTYPYRAIFHVFDESTTKNKKTTLDPCFLGFKKSRAAFHQKPHTRVPGVAFDELRFLAKLRIQKNSIALKRFFQDTPTVRSSNERIVSFDLSFRFPFSVSFCLLRV